MTTLAEREVNLGLRRALDAVVPISAHIPDDAMSATLLGTERSGNGVIIRDDGLIATIDYLVVEAENVWVGAPDGTMLPGYVVGCDHESGFGLVRTASPLEQKGVHLGSGSRLALRDPVVVAASGGANQAIDAIVAAKQEFAGRWEYVLDEAIYTVPAHDNWAGAGLFDQAGRLCGIGSLLVQSGSSGENRAAANLFVPIDLLVPVVDEICEYGRKRKAPRPWLGILVHDADDQLLVAGVYRNCPGERAGLKPGDVITALKGKPPGDLAAFLRAVWRLGDAGVEVPLTISRDDEEHEVKLKSADRAAFARKGTVN